MVELLHEPGDQFLVAWPLTVREGGGRLGLWQSFGPMQVAEVTLAIVQEFIKVLLGKGLSAKTTAT
jgi:hypothetical protein